ncbi:MAG: hypothetical protein NC082_04505 [Clostridiales bacterium]|nr:hypothetical protein [Clostridiales bacterium]
MENDKLNKELCSGNHDWKGYSLEQLEHLRLVNKVKQDLIKEQLSIVYRSATAQFTTSGENTVWGSQINKYMSYVTYGVAFAGYARRLYTMFRSVKSFFSSDKTAGQ